MLQFPYIYLQTKAARCNNDGTRDTQHLICHLRANIDTFLQCNGSKGFRQLEALLCADRTSFPWVYVGDFSICWGKSETKHHPGPPDSVRVHYRACLFRYILVFIANRYRKSPLSHQLEIDCVLRLYTLLFILIFFIICEAASWCCYMKTSANSFRFRRGYGAKCPPHLRHTSIYIY